jgi:hypothetical protein
MSNLQAKKILEVQTPMELFEIIQSLNDDSGFIVPFLDKADLFLNGCSCEAETYWDQMIHEYKLLPKFDFTSIKNELQCDVIRLHLNDEFMADV